LREVVSTPLKIKNTGVSALKCCHDAGGTHGEPACEQPTQENTMTEAQPWPRKTRERHNHHFDSTIWNDFRFRDDDIVIAT